MFPSSNSTIRCLCTALESNNWPVARAALEATLDREESASFWQTTITAMIQIGKPHPEISTGFHTLWTERGHRIREQVKDDDLLRDALRNLLPVYVGPGLKLYRGESVERWKSQNYGFAWTDKIDIALMFARGLNAMAGQGGVLLSADAPSWHCCVTREPLMWEPNMAEKSCGDETDIDYALACLGGDYELAFQPETVVAHFINDAADDTRATIVLKGKFIDWPSSAPTPDHTEIWLHRASFAGEQKASGSAICGTMTVSQDYGGTIDAVIKVVYPDHLFDSVTQILLAGSRDGVSSTMLKITFVERPEEWSGMERRSVQSVQISISGSSD